MKEIIADDQARIVYVNGPPGSGKDTVARILGTWFNARHLKFKDKLDELLAAVHDIPTPVLREMQKRENKDIPNKTFLDGMSYRNAVIHLSENVIKPAYGTDYFGVVLARRIRSLLRTSARTIVISDCGFSDELRPVSRLIDHDNQLIIRLARPGCSFHGDSRSYVDHSEIPIVNIMNEHSMKVFEALIWQTVVDHFKLEVGDE